MTFATQMDQRFLFECGGGEVVTTQKTTLATGELQGKGTNTQGQTPEAGDAGVRAVCLPCKDSSLVSHPGQAVKLL